MEIYEKIKDFMWMENAGQNKGENRWKSMKK